MHPPVPHRPSMFGQVNPPSSGSLTTRLPWVLRVKYSKVW